MRSQNKIELALLSSGIAATLLDGGRTAHSALKLPLNYEVNETPACNISKKSGTAKLFKHCGINIWDECTMANKKSVETLERTMKDIRDNSEVFGGALILLSGDFRQTLPGIPRSTTAEEINASLKLQNDPSADKFFKKLLKIGNGAMPVDETGSITLPNDFCRFVQSKGELIESVFPENSTTV